MDTLNNLYAIHSKLIKMLVDSDDEAVKGELIDILADLGDVMAKEMKKAGVEYIG